jgi:peptidoglycan/LPS O-acetylase OafA/YrhL
MTREARCSKLPIVSPGTAVRVTEIFREGAAMGSRNRRGSGWFGAAVLIAVGIIGLAVNFDLVPRQFLSQIWKLWPLIPLVIGIGILMRRQRVGDDQIPPGKE